jgi:hypothetical protein
MYTVKANRTTAHIAGIEARSTGTQFAYAENACGVLTTNRRLATVATFETLAEALAFAKASGRKVCKTCQTAADAALSAPQAEDAPEVQAEAAEPVAATVETLAAQGVEIVSVHSGATVSYRPTLADPECPWVDADGYRAPSSEVRAAR